jgi:transcriptional regulator with XRE-family HTH domain
MRKSITKDEFSLYVVVFSLRKCYSSCEGRIQMDQKKTGAFLKELRKEKGLTQEQLAEQFHVSNRTVSRWENGNNMPDLDILIEMSDFYGIDFRELLDGERRSEKMDNEYKEVALKAVDYTNNETERYNVRIHLILLVGAVLWVLSLLISHTSLVENHVMSAISEFSEGAACSMIIFGIIVTSRYGQRIQAFKQRLLLKNKWSCRKMKN